MSSCCYSVDGESQPVAKSDLIQNHIEANHHGMCCKVLNYSNQKIAKILKMYY